VLAQVSAQQHREATGNVAELLRISHKHGNVTMRPAAPGGRRLPFNVDMLLPVLASNPLDWL
jgi:hypothetical protein